MRHDEMRQGEMRREEMQGTAVPSPVRSDGQYEVQPNDSYWTISEHIYGSGAYFRALAEANRGKEARPDRLTPGLLISTPPVAQLEKDYPDFCPRDNRRETLRNRAAGAASMAAYAAQGRTYTVQEGDTLSSIAHYELGKITRWADIYPAQPATCWARTTITSRRACGSRCRLATGRRPTARRAAVTTPRPTCDKVIAAATSAFDATGLPGGASRS